MTDTLVPGSLDSPPSAVRMRGRMAVWALTLLVCSSYALAPAGGLGLPLDDGWIHLQFASRIAAGDGLSYNPAVWVTGSTSPLWSAVVAMLMLLPGPILFWVLVTGSGLLVVAVDASMRLAALLGLGGRACLLVGVLVGTSSWLVWSALSGMEITLFLALSLLGVNRHLDERRSGGVPVSVALLAVACLARPEGVLLLVLALLDRTWMVERANAADAAEPEHAVRIRAADPRMCLEGLLLATVILLPTLLFYRGVGGSWLPSTFAVKGEPIRDLIPDGRYLRVVADVFFRSLPLLVLACGAGALRLVARLGTPRDRGLLPALWLFGLPLAYSLVTPPAGPPAVGNFGRYYFPLLPFVVVLGVLAVAAPSRRWPVLRLSRLRLPLGGLVAAVVVLVHLALLAGGRTTYARTVANVEASDVAAARWLAPRLDPAALIAVQDIGALKFLLPNRVLDLAGIVTPEIVPVLRGGDGYWENRLLAFLAQRQPDYLVVFAGSYPRIVGRTPGFERVQTFEVDGNITMAGDRLVVLSTPWNRYPLRELEK